MGIVYVHLFSSTGGIAVLLQLVRTFFNSAKRISSKATSNIVFAHIDILFVVPYLFIKGQVVFVKYLEAAVKRAEYKKLEDNSWFAEIPGFDGVWASTNTIENCRNELIEVLEEWILLKIRDQEEIPVLEGIDINIKLVPT